jgi:hypothetical protein
VELDERKIRLTADVMLLQELGVLGGRHLRVLRYEDVSARVKEEVVRLEEADALLIRHPLVKSGGVKDVCHIL